MLFSASYILYSITFAYLAVGGVETTVQRLLVLRVLTPDGLVPHLVAVDVLHLGVLVDEVILPPAGSHQTR